MHGGAPGTNERGLWSRECGAKGATRVIDMFLRSVPDGRMRPRQMLDRPLCLVMIRWFS